MAPVRVEQGWNNDKSAGDRYAEPLGVSLSIVIQRTVLRTLVVDRTYVHSLIVLV